MIDLKCSRQRREHSNQYEISWDRKGNKILKTKILKQSDKCKPKI